jgi:hypothetical protein
MSDFTFRDFFILIGGGGTFVGIFIWIGIALQMSSKKTQLLEYFARSEHLPQMSGVQGRVGFVWSVAFLVAFPRRSIRRGKLSADDFKNCPEALKRKLVIMQWVWIGLVSSFALAFAIIKLTEY